MSMLAARLVREFEGFSATPYLCPAGVPTIGYGATRYADGVRVSLADRPISRDTAEALMLSLLPVPAVIQLCPGIDNEGRLAALVDFAYNLGIGNLRASALCRRVNAGEWDLVPGELMRWVRAGGRVLPGLVRRRAAESALI